MCNVYVLVLKKSLGSRRPAVKKGEGKTPRTHQVIGSNPWEVVTPKMGNLGGDFGLVGSRRGPDTEGSKQKKILKKLNNNSV